MGFFIVGNRADKREAPALIGACCVVRNQHDSFHCVYEYMMTQKHNSSKKKIPAENERKETK